MSAAASAPQMKTPPAVISPTGDWPFKKSLPFINTILKVLGLKLKKVGTKRKDAALYSIVPSMGFTWNGSRYVTDFNCVIEPIDDL